MVLHNSGREREQEGREQEQEWFGRQEKRNAAVEFDLASCFLRLLHEGTEGDERENGLLAKRGDET